MASSPSRSQPVKVKAHRGDIGGDLLGRLLEGHQHARLAVLPGAGDQELQSQQRLATPGAARHQRGPALGQPAPGDLIQSPDTGRGLRQQRASRSV